MRLFTVVHDGPSRPMIQTPKGRLLSISEFRDGRWGSYDDEEKDCNTIVQALNWLLLNGERLAELAEIMDEIADASDATTQEFALGGTA